MKRLLLITTLFCCLAMQARAEAMIISLEALRDTATHVVYATFRGPVDTMPGLYGALSYNLEVHEVIKGKLKPGIVKVYRGSGHASLPRGQAVIAFLTDDLEFSWCALPRGLQADPRQDLWHLEGFYDWNAYIVGTHDLTLPMIKTYFVERKPLSCRYQGAICFFDPQTKALAPSRYLLDIQSTDGQPSKFLTNLPLHDFAQGTLKPSFRAGLYSDLTSSVTGRSMEISGREVAVDASTGTMTCEFWLPSPALYTEEILLAFLADPKIYHPWYVLTVNAPNAETWTIALGENSGRIGGIAGTKWGALLPFSEISDEPITFVTGFDGGERIKLVANRTQEDDFGLPSTGTEGGIIQNLLIAPLNCKVYRGEKEHETFIGTATISLQKVNYKRY